MNTSSFFCGVLIGAAVSTMMSRKRSGGGMMSSLISNNGPMGKAADKVMDMASTGFGNSTKSGSGASQGSSASQHTKQGESPVRSKESNLKMLKEFIRTNPDVKHEVEAILKETHTAIPGL